MKNTIFFFAAALLLSLSANAQSTVDSIQAKYELLPMPEALTLEKTFPVIGNYHLNAEDGNVQEVIITLDQENKGIVWVEGLPEGKFKAYLKKSPGTYRIISQKTESGRQLPEGTLMFDPSTSTLHVAMGKKFDESDPAAIFNLSGDDVASTEVKVKSKTPSSKSKSKILFYTAIKQTQNISSVTPPEQNDPLHPEQKEPLQ